jgi:hypothetical protein
MDELSRKSELEDGVLIVLPVDDAYALISSRNQGRICLLLVGDLKIRHSQSFPALATKPCMKMIQG